MSEERIVDSALAPGSCRIKFAQDAADDGLITVVGGATVDPAELADALNGIIPGFTATYEEQVDVPQGIGAVVVDVRGKSLVRFRQNGEWTWKDDRSFDYSEEDIAQLLREGGKVLFEGVQA